MRVDGGEHLAVAAVPELAVDVELGGEADVHLVHVHLHRCVFYKVFYENQNHDYGYQILNGRSVSFLGTDLIYDSFICPIEHLPIQGSEKNLLLRFL